LNLPIKWDEKVRQAGFKSCNSMARTMAMHSQNMRNYVDHRNTNASAEAFNAKIKAFRVQSRWDTNNHYVLFSIPNIFAER
jgi:transposase